jgi:glycosyltransferase involved in cell wall biosynthesis
LDNPELLQRVKAFEPDAVLQFGYNYKSLVNFDLRWNTKRAALMFRGDSHLLAEDRERGKGQEAMGTRLKRWMREIGLRLLFRRFACFLAVGKANADYFRAHGVPESKIVFCPHVVDNAFFLEEKKAGTRHEATGNRGEGRGLREELGIPEDDLVFLFAGKLEEKKQPLLLLEAFLRADLPKATLLFVGSGKLESALRAKATESHGLKKIEEDSFSGGDCLGAISDPQVSGSAGKPSSPDKTENCALSRGLARRPLGNTANCGHRVVFLEFQNQSAMPAVYRTGDVLVLPSKGRYETWGLAVNEAACCGLPAIVSSHVGCGPDLIEDGGTGWVFEAGNVEALQRALETAAANRGRLVAMGEALMQRVTRDYSYQSATEALLAELDNLKP